MLPGQVPESSLHTVSRGGVAHGLADREPHLCRRRGCVRIHPEVDHERGGAGATPLTHRAAKTVSGGEAVDSGEHGACRGRWPSDGQALAALAATARQDGATGTGPHAQAEAVHLVTATVVRLVRTLAHGYFSEGFEGCPLHTGVGAGPGSGPKDQVLRPAPPARVAAWWRIVDMRHPSTGSDRPTVRGRRTGGQTHGTPRTAGLWMTSCSAARPVVTFGASAVRPDLGPTRVQHAM